jgi:hypothetical protein
MAVETLTINIVDVVDTTLNTNEMSTYTMTIAIDDLTAPTISTVALDAANNLLYVFFNEELNDTALVSTNYYIVDDANAYTKLSEEAAFFTNSKIVKIALTDAQEAKLADNDDKVFITGVEDAAGNEIEVNLSGNYVALATLVPAMDTVEATSTTTIVITYEQELGSVDKDAFAITGGLTVASMSVALNDDGVTVVTLTLDEGDALDPDTAAIEVSYADETLVEDLFGTNPSAIESVEIDDAIAPAFDSIAEFIGDYDTDGDDPEQVIVVTFTEDLAELGAGLAAQDLVVKNADGDTLVAGVDYSTTINGADIEILIGTDVNGAAAGDLVGYSVASKDTVTYITDNTAEANGLTAFTAQEVE